MKRGHMSNPRMSDANAGIAPSSGRNAAHDTAIFKLKAHTAPASKHPGTHVAQHANKHIPSNRGTGKR